MEPPSTRGIPEFTFTGADLSFGSVSSEDNPGDAAPRMAVPDFSKKPETPTTIRDFSAMKVAPGSTMATLPAGTVPFPFSAWHAPTVSAFKPSPTIAPNSPLSASFGSLDLNVSGVSLQSLPEWTASASPSRVKRDRNDRPSAPATTTAPSSLHRVINVNISTSATDTDTDCDEEPVYDAQGRVSKRLKPRRRSSVVLQFPVNTPVPSLVQDGIVPLESSVRVPAGVPHDPQSLLRAKTSVLPTSPAVVSAPDHGTTPSTRRHSFSAFAPVGPSHPSPTNPVVYEAPPPVTTRSGTASPYVQDRIAAFQHKFKAAITPEPAEPTPEVVLPGPRRRESVMSAFGGVTTPLADPVQPQARKATPTQTSDRKSLTPSSYVGRTPRVGESPASVTPKSTASVTPLSVRDPTPRSSSSSSVEPKTTKPFAKEAPTVVSTVTLSTPASTARSPCPSERSGEYSSHSSHAPAPTSDAVQPPFNHPQVRRAFNEMENMVEQLRVRTGTSKPPRHTTTCLTAYCGVGPAPTPEPSDYSYPPRHVDDSIRQLEHRIVAVENSVAAAAPPPTVQVVKVHTSTVGIQTSPQAVQQRRKLGNTPVIRSTFQMPTFSIDGVHWEDLEAEMEAETKALTVLANAMKAKPHHRTRITVTVTKEPRWKPAVK